MLPCPLHFHLNQPTITKESSVTLLDISKESESRNQQEGAFFMQGCHSMYSLDSDAEVNYHDDGIDDQAQSPEPSECSYLSLLQLEGSADDDNGDLQPTISSHAQLQPIVTSHAECNRKSPHTQSSRKYKRGLASAFMDRINLLGFLMSQVTQQSSTGCNCCHLQLTSSLSCPQRQS